jgi:hypothetical protein
MTSGFQDDGTEDYKFQEEEDEDFIEPDGSEAGSGMGRRRGTGVQPQRRSARTAALNANGKRSASSDALDYKGERRSTRLGAQRDLDDDDASTKRARTEDSASVYSMDDETAAVASNEEGQSISAVRPVEVEVPGKKKSKFYYYVSEPIPGAPLPPAAQTNSEDSLSATVAPSVTQTNGGDPVLAVAHTNGADPLAAVNGLANIHIEGSDAEKVEEKVVAELDPPQVLALDATVCEPMDVDHPKVEVHDGAH